MLSGVTVTTNSSLAHRTSANAFWVTSSPRPPDRIRLGTKHGRAGQTRPNSAQLDLASSELPQLHPISLHKASLTRIHITHNIHIAQKSIAARTSFLPFPQYPPKICVSEPYPPLFHTLGFCPDSLKKFTTTPAAAQQCLKISRFPSQHQHGIYGLKLMLHLHPLHNPPRHRFANPIPRA